MSTPVRLTMLSDMCGQTARQQADQASKWKFSCLDVKTVSGKNIVDLTDSEADELAAAYAEKKVAVQAFSTALYKRHVEAGEAGFKDDLNQLDRVLVLAKKLRPAAIRLIAPETTRRKEIADSSVYLKDEFQWVLPLYVEAVKKIHDAGFTTVIENETSGSMFAKPQEVVGFFEMLGHRDKVGYTWDVQNMWQLGTYPTLDVYTQMKPYIGYFHLKGGAAGPDPKTLKWRATLEQATWPVLEITRAIIADGVSPVICLNPSHGEIHPEFPVENAYGRDLAFLRRELGSLVD